MFLSLIRLFRNVYREYKPFPFLALEATFYFLPELTPYCAILFNNFLFGSNFFCLFSTVAQVRVVPAQVSREKGIAT
jgi:hypothetical protein